LLATPIVLLVRVVPHAVRVPYMPGPYQLARDGRYTVVVSDGVTDAELALLAEVISARMAKRPMWLVCQVAVNEPSPATVVETVLAHAQLVWWPERWISIVLPAAEATVPENVRLLRRIADALVRREIPSPLVLTVTLPLESVGAVVDGSVVLLAEPEDPVLGPLRPEPPEAAPAAEGTASAAHSSASRAGVWRRRFTIDLNVWVMPTR
jgi:hypothetical protein